MFSVDLENLPRFGTKPKNRRKVDTETGYLLSNVLSWSLSAWQSLVHVMSMPQVCPTSWASRGIDLLWGTCQCNGHSMRVNRLAPANHKVRPSGEKRATYWLLSE